MLLDSYEHAEEDLKRALLAEARVEAERILAALQGGARRRRAAARTREERADDRRRARGAGSGGAQANDHRAIRHAHRGARPGDQAVRRAPHERSDQRGHRRAPGGRDRRRRSSTPRAPEGSRGNALNAEGHLSARRKFDRGAAGDVDPRGGEEGHAQVGYRLRRRVRLLDLPRLREAGRRLAHRAAREGGGHPRQGVRRAADLAASAASRKVADEDVVVEITRESRQAWFDEHPEERASR